MVASAAMRHFDGEVKIFDGFRRVNFGPWELRMGGDPSMSQLTALKNHKSSCGDVNAIHTL